jgi:hypothetical protein
MEPTTTVIVNGREVPVPGNFYSLSADDQNQIVDRTAIIHGVGKQPAYSGSILPISRDTAGNTRFDPSAGLPATIVRSLYDAFKLPGDVATGQQPALDPVTGRTAPGLVDRSINLAATISPTSPANIAGRPSMLQPPTAPELKAAGGAGFDAARATGLEVQGGAVGNMAAGARQQLEADGFIQPIAPKTHALVDALQPPAPGATMNIAGLQAARQRFMELAIGNDKQEADAAGQMVRQIDGMLENLTPAQTAGGTASAQEVSGMLATARGNYGAGQRSNVISGDLDRASTGILERADAQAAATNSGKNFDNALRQRVNAFLKEPSNLLGFSDAEIAMLERVRDGSATQNQLRSLGNLFGGGGGLGRLAAGTTGGASGLLTGLLAGIDPVTATAAGTVIPPAVGALSKALENILARRSVGAVDEALRSRSPLYQNRAGMQQPALDLTARDTAILRSLLPGLLMPQPTPTGVAPTTSRLPPGFI